MGMELVVKFLMTFLIMFHFTDGISIKSWLKLPASQLLFKPDHKKDNASSETTGTSLSLFSCLEEDNLQSFADYVNCHLFCPSCQQGFGQCKKINGEKLCICDCKQSVQLHRECSSVQKYCPDIYEIKKSFMFENCRNACVSEGFSDGVLCGLDDPPILNPTCTCLCPKLRLTNSR